MKTFDDLIFVTKGSSGQFVLSALVVDNDDPFNAFLHTVQYYLYDNDDLETIKTNFLLSVIDNNFTLVRD